MHERLPQPSARLIRFGVFEFEAETGDLWKAGRRIKLQEQQRQVLAMLVSRPGELISRDDLCKTLWPDDTFVDFDTGLNVVITKLRQALDDSPASPRFIETFARRGYRFVAPVVEAVEAAATVSAQPVEATDLPGPALEPSVAQSSAARSLERPRAARLRYLVATLLALAATAGVFYSGSRWGRPLVSSRDPTAERSHTWLRVTFRRGFQTEARFAPDGQNVIYDAEWDGKRSEIFLTRIGSPEARSFGLKDFRVLSVSRTGELAILHDRMLMQMPSAGGTPRDVKANVDDAEWSPDGRSLLISWGNPPKRIEFPVGKELYNSPAVVVRPRFSPQGDKIAFIEMRPPGIGSVFVMDLAGSRQKLYEADMSGAGTRGLAWSPSGDEIWFGSNPRTGNGSLLGAVSLSGRYREILSLDQYFKIYDIFRDGRVLVGRGSKREGIVYFSPTEGRERDLSWLDGSWLADISEDGKTLVFLENKDGMGPNDRSTYIRHVDRSDAVRLGDGWPWGLSPDGKWILAYLKKSLVLVPTGAGETRTVAPLDHNEGAAWFPDGRRILYASQRGSRNGTEHLIVQDISGGEPRTISRDGVYLWGNVADLISPDGKWVIAYNDDRGSFLHSTEGDESRDFPGELKPEETAVRWSGDGSAIFVEGGVPSRIFRVDVKSGRREFWKELMPADPAGVHTVVPFLASDGRTYAYAYARSLMDLYVIEGLK
jgi:DNA-binding winged helix-turn-helix (wHTH) protein/Tol biopolymer transport system component